MRTSWVSSTPGPAAPLSSPPNPRRPLHRAGGQKAANWSGLPDNPFLHILIRCQSVSLPSISRAWRKLPTSAERFPINPGVRGELIFKEALSRDTLVCFPQVVPGVLTVENHGDSPPTHSFTLLLARIFRQEFPSHRKAGEMFVLPFAWQHHCPFRAERKTVNNTSFFPPFNQQKPDLH